MVRSSLRWVRPISGRGPTTPWPPLVNAYGICRAAGKRNKFLILISAFVMFADLKSAAIDG